MAHVLGELISADTDNSVHYSKLGKQFTVTKSLFMGYSDSKELYEKEMHVQTKLALLGMAPKVLYFYHDTKNGREYMTWVSEDAGLPLEAVDIPAANAFLDKLYDMGFEFEFLHEHHFTMGFDGKVKMVDCKQVTQSAGSIDRSKREYL